MLTILSKALNIQRDEWPKLGYLSGFIFLFVLGITWAQIIIPATFIAQVGPALLPYLFIGDAIAVMAAMIVYSAFVDRFSHERVMLWILLLAVGGVCLGRVLLSFGLIQIGYIYLYILFRILFDTLSIHVGTYRSIFFDTQSAKRAYPILFSVLRFANIAAGLSIPLLNSFLAPENILILWGLTMAGMGLLMLNRFRWVKSLPDNVSAADKRPSYIQNTREALKYVKESPYLRSMALAALAVTITLALLNFEFLRVFNSILRTSSQIANYQATLTVIGGIIIFPFQLFVISRIVSRIGVGSSSLIYPSILLGVSGLMISFPAMLTVSGLAYFNNNTIKVAFGIVNELLYNAVPIKIRGRARVFVNGTVIPFGTLLAGLIVLLPFTSQGWFLPVFLGGFAIAAAIASYVLRKNYAQAMVKLLEQENDVFFANGASSVLESVSGINLADRETINFLKKKLYESSDPNVILLSAQLLVEALERDAVPLLEPLTRTGTPEVHTGLLTIFAENKIHSDLTHQLYANALNNPDMQVRKAAITGLEVSGLLNTPEYLAAAKSMLSTADKDIQLQVLPLLLNNPQYNQEAAQMLQNLLQSQQSATRVIGLELLGKVFIPQHLATLLQSLDDPVDTIRLAALTSLNQALPKAQKVDLLLPRLKTLCHDDSEQVRIITIHILAEIQTPDAATLLIALVSDSSEVIRREAIHTLIGKGKAVIPQLRALLNVPPSPLRQSALYILASINLDEYKPTVLSSIEQTIEAIYRNIIRFHAAKVILKDELFAQIVNERNQVLIADLFQMLGVLHNPESLKVIREAFSTDVVATRANASEALEAMLSPKLGKLISAILAPTPKTEDLVTIGYAELDFKAPTPKEAAEGLLTTPDDFWLRAFTAFMLGTVSLSSAKPPQPPTKTDRRRRAVNLLDSLITEGDAQTKPQNAPEEQAQPAPVSAPENDSLVYRAEELQKLLGLANGDPVEEVRTAAQAAQRIIDNKNVFQLVSEVGTVLSTIEKIIFLKSVPFFQGMMVDQLKVLAALCEEQLFAENATIFDEGAQGGVLYVIVRGRVGIERKNAATRTSARISTLEVRSYFGEDTLFDKSATATTAIALDETLTLRLRHEPLVALMQDNPELSLGLIKILGQRLRETSEQVAALTRNLSRSMHQVYDKLG